MSDTGRRSAGTGFAGYQVGQVIGAAAGRVEGKRTAPPERYTQATLVDDMVAAYKFGRNDAEREILKDIGLGTSRTRVPMITGLIKRGLLETVKVGKQWQIRTSAVAREMLRDVPEDLRNVAMTARWEVALAAIRMGKVRPEDVIAKGYQFVDQLVAHAKSLKAARGGGARGVAERGSIR